MPISFDPNLDPVAQGYTANGGVTPLIGGGLLTINDQPNDHLFYTRPASGIAGGVRVRCTFGITPGALEGGTDTGVQFALDEGAGGRRIELRCVQVGLERRVGFTTSSGNVSTGTAYDWATDGSLDFRRAPNGDAVLTVGGTDVETIASGNLAASIRPAPTFEFGCYSDEAQVSARFGAITEVDPDLPISLDPTLSPLAQGYTADGGATAHVGGGIITINDPPNDHLFYTRPASGIAGGVRVRCTFGITPGTLEAGSDTGVAIAVDDGVKRVELRCVMVGTERRVGFRLSGGNVSPGAVYDWATDGTLEFRREPNGDAALTIGGVDVETIPAFAVAGSIRPAPTFEFGCYSDAAQVSARFGVIEEVAPPPGPDPTTFVVNAMQIHPQGSEKVQFDATGGLPSGAAIDPATEPVALRLRTGGTEFYPDTRWSNPINGFNSGDPWAINSAEKSRTGIQSFHFSQPDASGNFTAHFVDTKADVPSQDFSTVEVEVVIGDDTFTEQVALVLDGKVWRLV